MSTLFESWWNLFFVASFAVFVYLLDLCIIKLKYFDRRKVLYVKQNFISSMRALKSGVNIDECFDKIYRKYPEARYVGYYFGLEPSYLIRDPDLVNTITKSNFTKFHDRYHYGADEEVDPLAANLVNLTGDKWKELRCKLNPGFTTIKMQWMFPLMQGCANSLAQQLRKSNPDPEQDVDANKLFSSITFSTLASCGFGVEPESIKDPESQFKKMIILSLNVTPLKMVIIFLKRNLPVLSSLITSTPKLIEDYFTSLTKTEMKKRRNQSNQRSDFLQLLIQIKDDGQIQHDTAEQMEDMIQQPAQKTLEWNDGVVSSQMLMFFQLGYKPASQLVSMACYHLSKHPQIQDRIRRELREAKKRHRTLNYQAIKDITFLDNCISESLRLFPPTGLLKRVCTEDLVLGDGGVIEKGCNVMIPVMSLQNDTKFWSKPNVYDPERFTRDKIIPGTYLPFGQGPRSCIGQKFALLHAKVILAKILENFQLIPSPKTQEPLKRGKWLDSNVSGGIWIRLQAIDLSTV